VHSQQTDADYNFSLIQAHTGSADNTASCVTDLELCEEIRWTDIFPSKDDLRKLHLALTKTSHDQWKPLVFMHPNIISDWIV
jgi:hypothetical protein